MSEIVKIQLTYQEEFAISVAKAYERDVEMGEKMIRDSAPLRCCLLDVYKWLVKNRGLEDYENVDQETKNKLLGSSEQVCLCLWVLNFVFEKYFV